MKIIRFFMAVVIALCALLHSHEDLPPVEQFTNQPGTVYISTVQEDYSTESVVKSVVCRLCTFFIMACVLISQPEEIRYLPPIRRVIIGIKRSPKFRPQKARSVVSEDDYLLHYTCH